MCVLHNLLSKVMSSISWSCVMSDLITSLHYFFSLPLLKPFIANLWRMVLLVGFFSSFFIRRNGLSILFWFHKSRDPWIEILMHIDTNVPTIYWRKRDEAFTYFQISKLHVSWEWYDTWIYYILHKIKIG